jgi:cytochrome c peroxidase
MKFIGIAIAIVIVFGAIGTAHADEALRKEAGQLFGRIDAPVEAKAGAKADAKADASSPQAELGRALFWNTRISADGKTSCASCHLARDWGADRRRFSTDTRGVPTSRHSPTVFNSMGQPSLRWLGDRKSSADQAEGSITGSMGFASKDAALAKLAEPGYTPLFAAAFAQDTQPLSAANYGRALEVYQATLITPAPFDRFLAGDDRALREAQKSGLRTFIATGCAACRNGAVLGGAMLQKFGLTKDYWLETGSEKPDVGRFSVT